MKVTLKTLLELKREFGLEENAAGDLWHKYRGQKYLINRLMIKHLGHLIDVDIRKDTKYDYYSTHEGRTWNWIKEWIKEDDFFINESDFSL